MELLFRVRVIVGNDLRNYDIKLFSFDYDIEKADLEEFAKHCGFDNALDLLTTETSLLFGKDSQEVKEIETEYEDYPSGCETYLSKQTLRLFEEFLVRKYQEKVENWLVNVLTHNSEKTLNDLIYYDFCDY